MNSHPVPVCLICVTFCVAWLSNSSASVDICQEPIADSHLAIRYHNSQASAFDGSPGETNLENYSTELLYKMNNDWILGFGHRSTVLNVDRLELQTNGYLHTFFFPVHRSIQSDKRHFRFSIAPALSASSNVSSDPDEYRSDALQLLAALIWDRQLSDRVSLHYGICADHRFGDYQAYPAAGINWQPGPKWTIEFGFPTSQISHELGKNLTTVLRIAPNGNEWYVKDKSLERRSQLVYEAYLIELALDWRAHKHIGFSASVGRDFHNRFKMTLLDGTRVRLSSDPATRAGVAFAWFF